MNNNQKYSICVGLTTLTLVGWMPMGVAGDRTNAQSPDPYGITSEPAVIGSPKTSAASNARGFIANIEQLSLVNEDFRHVLYTAKHAQLVVMALKPGERIGSEVHPEVDQFLSIEEGVGEAVLDNARTPIRAGYAALIPAGVKHDIVNTGKTPMKLYTLYAPPQHRDGVIHHTRTEAENDREEHFDGKTTQ